MLPPFSAQIVYLIIGKYFTICIFRILIFISLPNAIRYRYITLHLIKNT